MYQPLHGCTGRSPTLLQSLRHGSQPSGPSWLFACRLSNTYPCCTHPTPPTAAPPQKLMLPWCAHCALPWGHPLPCGRTQTAVGAWTKLWPLDRGWQDAGCSTARNQCSTAATCPSSTQQLVRVHVHTCVHALQAEHREQAQKGRRPAAVQGSFLSLIAPTPMPVRHPSAHCLLLCMLSVSPRPIRGYGSVLSFLSAPDILHPGDCVCLQMLV